MDGNYFIPPQLKCLKEKGFHHFLWDNSTASQTCNKALLMLKVNYALVSDLIPLPLVHIK